MTRNNVEHEVLEKLNVHARFGRVSRPRRWLAVATGLAAATGLVAWVWSNEPSAPKYRTQPVERGELIVTVTATGTLEPVNQVDVGSELSGIIEMVEADFNDLIKKWQNLARLDTDRHKAQVLEGSKCGLSETGSYRITGKSVTRIPERMKLIEQKV